MSRLSWAMWQAAARRPKVLRKQVTKMTEFYREEALEEGEPSRQAQEFRVEDG